jgi:hypothetical protein
LDQTDCSLAEPTYDGGWPNEIAGACATAGMLRPGLQAAIVPCLAEITDDACGPDAAAAAASCRAAVEGTACDLPVAAAACTTGYDDGYTIWPAVLTSCSDGTLTVEACTSVLSQYSYPDPLVDCMDPAGEYYDATFAGDCAARLEDCRTDLL